MTDQSEAEVEHGELVKWLEQMREQSIEIRDECEKEADREHYRGRINAFQAVLEYVDGREYPPEAWEGVPDRPVDGGTDQ